MREYKAKQIMNLMGIDRNMYSGLVRGGNIFCSYPSHKQGSSNRFSEEDLHRNMLIAELIKCGISSKHAFKVINDVRVIPKVIEYELSSATTITINVTQLLDKLGSTD